MDWWGASRFRVSFAGMPWLALGASSATANLLVTRRRARHLARSTPQPHTTDVQGGNGRPKSASASRRGHCRGGAAARMRRACTNPHSLHDGRIRIPPPRSRVAERAPRQDGSPRPQLTGERAALRGREPRRDAGGSAPPYGRQASREHGA